MTEYTITYTEDQPNTIELPNTRFKGGRYRILADEAGSVDLFGNQEGLLYLAEILVRCALGNHGPGFHVHLPRTGVALEPDLSGGPELTIYSPAADVVE